MKATFQEWLVLALAKVGNSRANRQLKRVEAAQELVAKRKMAHLDIALIAADAFTDYRLLKRDRYNAAIDKAEAIMQTDLGHVRSLRTQANYLEQKAKGVYADIRQENEDKIEAIYKEKLA